MWSPKRNMWSPRLNNVESKIAFGQLIFRKIIKTVATRCQIFLKAKMHQNPNFGWGSAPVPAGGAYSTPDPLAGFKGPTSNERGGGIQREGR